jgi:hypothetical protein
MICSFSIRKPIVVSIVLVASFTAGAKAPMSWPRPGFHVPMVANLPFTADLVEENWNYLPDGSETHHFKTVYSIARDNDGRVSVKHPPSSGTPMAFLIDIWDPIAGTETSFHSCVQDAKDPTSSDGCAVEKVATVWPAPRRNPDSGPPVFPDPFKPLPAHHSSDLVPRSGELVDLGEKSIEGTKVRGYRNVATSHVTCNGVPLTTSKEWWLSEESALEVSVTTRTSGPESLHFACSGTMTFELTNIQRVDPEPDLFQVPPDYEIVRRPPIKPRELVSSPKTE